MEGSDVQKYYEHTVIPANFRIVATARYIEPSHSRGQEAAQMYDVHDHL